MWEILLVHVIVLTWRIESHLLLRKCVSFLEHWLLDSIRLLDPAFYI